MATYAAKTGTQNFSDTWALVDATSANLTEGGVTNTTASTASWVASTNTFNFPSNAPTIDGIGLFVTATSMTTTTTGNGATFNLGTFSVRIATGGVAVSNTTVTVNVADIFPIIRTNTIYDDLTDKISGSWIFFKFDSTVSLSNSTTYTVDITSSVAGTVTLGVSSTAGTATWMRYLRTTSTGTPAATDRLFICGEINNSSAWSTNTVNHNSTDSSTSYGRVDIGAYGEWIWNNAASTNYYFKTSGDIRLGTRGKLQIGTLASPIPSTSTATIDFVSTAGAGCTLFCSRKSTLTMYGTEKTHLGYLQSNISAGVSTASVSASSSSMVDPGWKNGDLCTFSAYPTTASSAGYSADYLKTDTVTLNANSGSLSTPGRLDWSLSAKQDNTTQATTWYAHNTHHPWVANLTRNVKIKGASITNTFQFVVNTDLANLTAVEMYFIDGLRLRCGDNVTPRKIKNCVVRESRGVAAGTAQGGGGIILHSTKNMIVEDCIVARGSGINTHYFSNTNNVSLLGPTIIKNCVVINCQSATLNSLGTTVNSGNFVDIGYVFDGCVVTSNNSTVWFRPAQNFNNGVSPLKIINCHFGISSGNNLFEGLERFYIDTQNYWQAFSEHVKIESCKFYANPIQTKSSRLLFENCTFNKLVSAHGDYFIVAGTNTPEANQSQLNPNRFENCTFDCVTSNTRTSFYTSLSSRVTIINGGSTNTSIINLSSSSYEGSLAAGGAGGKLLFNNFSCPNWNLPNSTSVFGRAPALYGSNWSNGASDSFVQFQRYNQVEGDHRTYAGNHMIFPDTTVYDSSPKSIRVYSKNPEPGSRVIPIKIPIKKNQTATVSFKVKISEPQATYMNGNTQVTSSFVGKVPWLLVKGNRALGSNYNSDITYYPSSVVNGEPNPTNFTPASLGSNLKLWLDASTLNDITYDPTFYSVSQWNDKSGNDNHLKQTTDAKKPHVNLNFSSGHGGYPVYFSQLLDQRLVSDGNILGGTTAELETFIVCSAKYYVPYGDVMGFYGPSVLAYEDYNNYSPGINSQVRGVTNTGIGLNIPNLETTVGESTIAIWHHTNSVANSQRRMNVNGYRNGSNGLFAQDATVRANFTPTNFALGVIQESTSASSPTYRAAHYNYYEIVVVNKAMSATEISNMNLYLCNKWNIAMRHATTSWKTVSYTLPAVSDDTVLEAWICVAGTPIQNAQSGYGPYFAPGWVNIDSITVT